MIIDITLTENGFVISDQDKPKLKAFAAEHSNKKAKICLMLESETDNYTMNRRLIRTTYTNGVLERYYVA